jgi:hypothetical protein
VKSPGGMKMMILLGEVTGGYEDDDVINTEVLTSLLAK